MLKFVWITRADVIETGGRWVHDVSRVYEGKAWVKKKLAVAGFSPEKPVRIRAYRNGDRLFEQGDGIVMNEMHRQQDNGGWKSEYSE